MPTSSWILQTEVVNGKIYAIGGEVPIHTEAFDLTEGETRDNSISGPIFHEYYITFGEDGNANFYFEKTSGNLDAEMILYRVGSTNLYPNQMLGDSDNMLITTGVQAGAKYRLEIINFGGSGDYFVRCKNYSIICSNNYLSYNDMKINAALYILFFT